MAQTPTTEGGAMRTVTRLALVGLVVGVGLAAADPPATSPPPALQAAVTLDWTGPPAVRLGKPNPFTLTVTNTGRATAQRVTVQVRLPADATVADAAPAVRAEDGVLVWDVGTLEPGEARPLALTLVAGRRGDLSCPAWVTFTSAAGMTVKVQEPSAAVRVIARDQVNVGDPFDVQYVGKNTGDCPLSGFEVVVHEAPFRRATDDGRYEQWAPKTTLPAGLSSVSTVRYVAGRPGRYTLRTTVRSADAPTAEASHTVTVVGPLLTATVTGPDKLLVGKTGRYTLTVKNAGELAVEDVTPTLPLPAGLKVSAAADGRLSWALGTLQPDEVREVWFDAVAAATGVQPVAVAVTGSRGATAAAECRTAVDGVPALRVELLDTADPVEVGKETVYEVRVTNTGTKADADVRLVCELPDALSFVSASGPTDHKTVKPIIREGGSSGGVWPCPGIEFEPVRELAPKTEAMFRVRVKAEAAGDVRFKAVVTSKHLTAPVTKEESTRVYGD